MSLQGRSGNEGEEGRRIPFRTVASFQLVQSIHQERYSSQPLVFELMFSMTNQLNGLFYQLQDYVFKEKVQPKIK